MAQTKCPALPSGSVDFSAYHEAASKPGADLAKAMEQATARTAGAPDKPAPPPTPAKPAAKAPADPDTPAKGA